MTNKTMSDETRTLAEFLHNIGWKSPCDAQWTNLQESLPALRELLAVPEGSAQAQHTPDSAPQIDVDQLAQFIRYTNGSNKMGAGALAERICEWLGQHPTAAVQQDRESVLEPAVSTLQYVLDALSFVESAKTGSERGKHIDYMRTRVGLGIRALKLKDVQPAPEARHISPSVIANVQSKLEAAGFKRVNASAAPASETALTDEAPPAYTITIAKINMGDDWHATACDYTNEEAEIHNKIVIRKTPEAALSGMLAELGEKTQEMSDLEALQMKYGMMKAAYEAEIACLRRALADEEMTDAERIAYDRFHKPEWLGCSHFRLRVVLSVCHEAITRCGSKIENLQDELAILQAAQPVDNLRDFANAVKSLCEDYSSRIGNVYIGDVKDCIDALMEQYAQPVAPRHASDMLYYAAAALLHACIDADKREELGDVDGTLLDRMAQAMADYEDAAKLHPAVAQPQGDLPPLPRWIDDAKGKDPFIDDLIVEIERLRDYARAALAQQKEGSKAAQDVLAERQRQVTAEGWEPEHDDEHACEELAAFACFYAMPPAAREWDASSTGYGNTLGEAIKPYDWQAKVGDRRRELVKAGALVIAEIERIDRSAAPSQSPQQEQQP